MEGGGRGWGWGEGEERTEEGVGAGSGLGEDMWYVLTKIINDLEMTKEQVMCR